MNNFFKNFGKESQNKNWSVVINCTRISGFKDWNNLSSLDRNTPDFKDKFIRCVKGSIIISFNT